MVAPHARVKEIGFSEVELVAQAGLAQAGSGGEFGIHAIVDHGNLFLGDVKQVLKVALGVLRDRNDPPSFSCDRFENPMIGDPPKPAIHLLAREKGKRQIMDRDDRGPIVKKRGIEVAKMHQVQLFPIQNLEEASLLGQRIMGKVGQNLGEPGVRRNKAHKRFFAKENHILIRRIQECKVANKLIRVASDAGEAGPVHSGIDSYSHNANRYKKIVPQK